MQTAAAAAHNASAVDRAVLRDVVIDCLSEVMGTIRSPVDDRNSRIGTRRK
jgi:hypothetical protein